MVFHLIKQKTGSQSLINKEIISQKSIMEFLADCFYYSGIYKIGFAKVSKSITNLK